ncbi:MAG: TSUP family transporter, partial [Acetobacteraceae bacterium]
MIHTALFVVLGAFLAALLRGFTGFGFVMAVVPLLGLMLPPARVVPLAILLQAEIGLIDLPAAVRLCDWHSLAWLVPGLLLGTPLGLLVLTSLSADRARLAIGLLIGASVVLLARGVRMVERPSRWLTLGVGVVSGTMNGLAGIAGPPVVAYLLALPHSTAVVRAS